MIVYGRRKRVFRRRRFRGWFACRGGGGKEEARAEEQRRRSRQVHTAAAAAVVVAAAAAPKRSTRTEEERRRRQAPRLGPSWQLWAPMLLQNLRCPLPPTTRRWCGAAQAPSRNTPRTAAHAPAVLPSARPASLFILLIATTAWPPPDLGPPLCPVESSLPPQSNLERTCPQMRHRRESKLRCIQRQVSPRLHVAEGIRGLEVLEPTDDGRPQALLLHVGRE